MIKQERQNNATVCVLNENSKHYITKPFIQPNLTVFSKWDTACPPHAYCVTSSRVTQEIFAVLVEWYNHVVQALF